MRQIEVGVGSPKWTILELFSVNLSPLHNILTFASVSPLSTYCHSLFVR
jgi:hypothetical protein